MTCRLPSRAIHPKTRARATGFAAAWFAVTGLGLGVAMPSAMNAALGAPGRPNRLLPVPVKRASSGQN